MKELKIKEGHKDRVIGFNNSLLPLGQRNDLHILLKAAKAHNVQNILDAFEEVPSDDDLKEIAGAAFLNKKNLSSKPATVATQTSNTVKEHKNEPAATNKPE